MTDHDDVEHDDDDVEHDNDDVERGEVEEDVDDGLEDKVVPGGPLTGAWVMRKVVQDGEEPLIAFVSYHFEAPEPIGAYLKVEFEDRFPGAFWDVKDVLVVEAPGARPFEARYPPAEVRRLRALLYPEEFARAVLGDAYDDPDPEA